MAGPGLYANIHAKRKRGGKMRKKGAKGAPTEENFARAKQTARTKKAIGGVAKAAINLLKKKKKKSSKKPGGPPKPPKRNPVMTMKRGGRAK